MSAGERTRLDRLRDIVNPRKTPEGRLTAFVVVAGAAAVVIGWAYPWLSPPMRAIAIACAILAVAIPLTVLFLRGDELE